jgi:hypothetical protein
MTNKQTGGPAFPAPAGVSHITEQGMTLRDYFASKAIQGLLANGEYFDEIGGTDAAKSAALAYKHADAMLKARDGQT